MSLLLGKAALITGAGSGIGRAAAIAFVREGASVLVADVNEDGGQETVDLANAERAGAARFMRVDVSAEADVRTMVESVVDENGRIDCAFNNAGVGGRIAPLEDYTEEDWHQVIDVDLKGVFWCMKYELLQMREQRSGVIVNTSSITGLTGFPPVLPALAAAKHAVEGLTKSAALIHAQNGIRVCVVRPGTIATAALDAAIAAVPDFEAQSAAAHPNGRLGQPEEVAEAVVWLSSDRASLVTGSGLATDGGFLAQ